MDGWMGVQGLSRIRLKFVKKNGKYYINLNHNIHQETTNETREGSLFWREPVPYAGAVSLMYVDVHTYMANIVHYFPPHEA